MCNRCTESLRTWTCFRSKHCISHPTLNSGARHSRWCFYWAWQVTSTKSSAKNASLPSNWRMQYEIALPIRLAHSKLKTGKSLPKLKLQSLLVQKTCTTIESTKVSPSSLLWVYLGQPCGIVWAGFHQHLGYELCSAATADHPLFKFVQNRDAPTWNFQTDNGN